MMCTCSDSHEGLFWESWSCCNETEFAHMDVTNKCLEKTWRDTLWQQRAQLKEGWIKKSKITEVLGVLLAEKNSFPSS